MFSIMTALVSPRVVETLEGRKDVLFQTLQERAGVLCVQPSHGICMLQGEWECMKKAHLVLEELCLQVQAQKSIMHNGRGPTPSKEELQKAFGLGGMSPDDSHLKLYEEMQQRQLAYAQWAATLNHQMAAGAHLAQQMAAQMLDKSVGGRRGSANGRDHLVVVEPPPREDTPLNLKKDLDPPRLERYGGSQHDDDDAESFRDEQEPEHAALTAGLSDEEASQNGGGAASPRRGSVEDSKGGAGGSMGGGRPGSRGVGGVGGGVGGEAHDMKPCFPEHNGMPFMVEGGKSNINTLHAMTQALVNRNASMRGDQAKYADPKAGMTAEGMISAQLMASGLPPYGSQFRAQNSPAPDEVALRSPFISQNYRLAAVELALLERRIQESHSGKVLGGIHDDDSSKDRYTPDRLLKAYPSTPIMPPKDRAAPNRAGKDAPGWLPRPPGPQLAQESAMDEDFDEQYFKCSACFAGFSNADALQEHMMTAHAVGPGLTAEKNNSLVVATSADSYCCPVCGKFYKSSQRLREHIPLHDKNYQRPTYPCPACQKTFTYRHNMKVHYQKIHKGREPPKRHQCTICGQKFHKPVYLRNHLLRHKETPDPGALDYTLAPSPLNLPPVVVAPAHAHAPQPQLQPQPPAINMSGAGVGSTESVGGEDTSASGSPGTNTSE